MSFRNLSTERRKRGGSEQRFFANSKVMNIVNKYEPWTQATWRQELQDVTDNLIIYKGKKSTAVNTMNMVYTQKVEAPFVKYLLSYRNPWVGRSPPSSANGETKVWRGWVLNTVVSGKLVTGVQPCLPWLLELSSPPWFHCVWSTLRSRWCLEPVWDYVCSEGRRTIVCLSALHLLPPAFLWPIL